MPKKDSKAQSFSTLLRNSEKGDEEALNELANQLYPVLKRIAKGIIGKAPDNMTLNPTALVNEVFVRFFLEHKAVESKDRTHFYAMMAKAMRWILVDHARARNAQRRGGPNPVHVTLSNMDNPLLPSAIDLIDFNNLLNELETQNSRALEIVQLRVFAGMTNEEVAVALGISTGTVKRNWKLAQAWLLRKLKANQAA